MIKSPPAFQFYVSDWLSSTSIALMSAHEERGYLRLLMHQWGTSDCSLPDDKKVLARLALVRRDSELDTILRQFVPHPEKPGRIINWKLYLQRKELDEFRAERAQSGRKGAMAKYGRGDSSASGSASRSASSSASGSAGGSALALHSSSSTVITPPTPPAGGTRVRRTGKDRETRVELNAGRGPGDQAPPLIPDAEKRAKWQELRRENPGVPDRDLERPFLRWMNEREAEITAHPTP